jgi:hypothetical protein
MAYTQADLDRIDAQIANVVSATSMADRSVSYRRLEELKEMREFVANALATQRAKQSFGVASKGF